MEQIAFESHMLTDRDMSDIQFSNSYVLSDWNKQNQVEYEYEPILQAVIFQYKTE
jgi:hypothetical protein